MGSKRIVFPVIVALLVAFVTSCDEEPRRIESPTKPTPQPVKKTLVETPEINADSAFAFVKKQVDFGPRVPNSASHKACAEWLEAKLASYGLETNVQSTVVKAYNGTELQAYNIMGQYRPELTRRVLLCAHWDTRPYADRDNDRRNVPIDGANDGGSGVGVLLEIARALSSDSAGPAIGVDIVFFDAEDYGKPHSSMSGNSNDSWCLGSQYWSENLPIENYKPEYGILLDMVGAPHAIFPQDYASLQYAPQVVRKVWGIARQMGHGDVFSNIQGASIIDDHVYVNKLAGIPTVDIVHYEMGRMDFGTFHHTHEDNLDGIDPAMLALVGQVVMQVIYQE